MGVGGSRSEKGRHSNDGIATGTGAVATMLADTNGPVAAGTVGGLTATVPTASNRATVFTLVLTAG